MREVTEQATKEQAGTEQQTVSAEQNRLPSDRLIWSVVSGVASGLVLWACFPPLRLVPLVSVALVPLVLTALRATTMHAALAGFAGGLTFGLISVWWLVIAHPTGFIGWIGLAAYLGVYWLAASLFLRPLARMSPGALPLSFAIVWVGLEYVRSWMLGGFPWFYLAHTLYRWPAALQGCAVLGAYALSFLLAWTNGLLAELLHNRGRPRRVLLANLGCFAGAWAVWLAYGLYSLAHAPDHLVPGPRVALVQTNVPQSLREQEDRSEELHRHFFELAVRCQSLQADLVVWPETTWRHVWLVLDEKLTDHDARRLVGFDVRTLRAIARRVQNDLMALARTCGGTIVMGINMQYLRPGGMQLYNSALLIRPDGPVYPPYHKIHLLPFGEYVPLERWLPILRIFSPNTRDSGSLTAGTETVVMTVNGISYGPLICFEDTVPSLAREFVKERGVDVLVNLTNDGWFGRSAEHEVHLAGAVFRSVECRRPLVRAVNTGISAVVDPYGRLTAVAGGSVENGVCMEDIVHATVSLHGGQSLYVSLFGDIVGQTCQVLLLVPLLFGTIRVTRVARRGKFANI